MDSTSRLMCSCGIKRWQYYSLIWVFGNGTVMVTASGLVNVSSNGVRDKCGKLMGDLGRSTTGKSGMYDKL